MFSSLGLLPHSVAFPGPLFLSTCPQGTESSSFWKGGMPPWATPGLGGGLMSILTDSKRWRIETQPTSWVSPPALGRLCSVKMHGRCGCEAVSLVGAHVMPGSSFLPQNTHWPQTFKIHPWGHQLRRQQDFSIMNATSSAWLLTLFLPVVTCPHYRAGKAWAALGKCWALVLGLSVQRLGGGCLSRCQALRGCLPHLRVAL